jgi:hypothetical protein
MVYENGAKEIFLGNGQFQPFEMVNVLINDDNSQWFGYDLQY